MRKKILIISLIVIIVVPLLIIIYPVSKNNNYEKKLLNNIYDNTDITDITYLNKDNNYYIIKTNDKVLVLDLNYEEKLSLDITKLQDSNLELVYRRNNLYYEEKVKEEEKLIYKFYNVETGVLEYQTSLGGSQNGTY